MENFPLILASASPRRRQLLEQLGIQFEVRSPDIDETILSSEAPETYVRRMALQKGEAVLNSCVGIRTLAVLSADTIVASGGRILGKPATPNEAKGFLRELSGRRHQVFTAVSLRVRADAILKTPLIQRVVTDVEFMELSPQQMDWYASTGEPSDKAGGYALQGIAGAWIKRVEGSVSNVIGLPLVETLALLVEAGFLLPWDSTP